MPVTIDDRGANNQVDAPDGFLDTYEGRITFEGHHNHVAIGRGSSCNGLSILCRSHGTIHVGDHVRLETLHVFLLAAAKLIVGEHTAFVGDASIAAHEARDITIGHNCLIAGGVSFTVSDMHSIVDVETGERVNPPRPIHVGHRFWLGTKATLLKGATIGDGSIVAAHALVSGAVPANALVGGIPAKVLRTNVTWRNDLI